MDQNIFIPKVFMAKYVAHRGYYMAVRRYEMSLRVLKNMYFTSKRCERVKYLQHEERNFVSPSGYVMFYLLYKHQWNTKPFQSDIFFLRKARFILCRHTNGDLITCYFHMWRSCFRVKAHLVFHWCLYNKKKYFYRLWPYCLVSR